MTLVLVFSLYPASSSLCFLLLKPDLYTRVKFSAVFVFLLLLIGAGARWRQSASMSNNKRNKNLHSTPLVCKAGFTGKIKVDSDFFLVLPVCVLQHMQKHNITVGLKLL